ncbi:hypothetical protein LCGC14_1665740 [marine sediment metagenome]|uniref:Bacteriophage head to tail connecting protein n=1 Tax=marine sediment metagenome TaxID=412755 RepID=A0A0F9HSN5_9ZZZZ
MAVDKNSRTYFDRRFASLKTERQSFDAHYKDLAQFIQPRRGRFFTTDRNRGGKRHQSIINSHATYAHRTAMTGLFAGIMNPARPWFRWETDDKDLMEFGPVKLWVENLEELMREIFLSGNLYNMAPTLFGEELLFGTGCMLHTDDFNDVARFYTLTAGSYWIAQDGLQRVSTLGREYEMTVEQLVGQFGTSNVSDHVKTQFDNGNMDTWVPVAHMIEPNPQFDPRRAESRFKAFRSVKYEISNPDKDKFLSRKGFDRFPSYNPRWEVTGEDVYGTNCPAMTALGDVKGLQTEEKRKGQAIAKMVNPPLKGPASLRQVPISALPGGTTAYDLGTGQDKLGPLYQVDPRLGELMADIDKVERRIDRAFFVDLFMAISSMEGIQPKNQLELSQRNEERLTQLGPALGRNHGELLKPLLENTFHQIVEADILPEPPEELKGKELNVKFVSSLAMAQQALATAGMERLTAFTTQLSQIRPEVVDKLDADQMIDEYGRLTGVPARVVVPDDIVAEVRQARIEEEQRQQQAAQLMELAKSGGGAVKDLTQAGAQVQEAQDRQGEGSET